MAKTMQEVLAEHRLRSGETMEGLYFKFCSCHDADFNAELEGDHAAHQASALSAAGYGLVADAKREAWDEGYEGAVDAYDGRNVSNPYRKASNDDQ